MINENLKNYYKAKLFEEIYYSQQIDEVARYTIPDDDLGRGSGPLGDIGRIRRAIRWLSESAMQREKRLFQDWVKNRVYHPAGAQYPSMLPMGMWNWRQGKDGISFYARENGKWYKYVKQGDTYARDHNFSGKGMTEQQWRDLLHDDLPPEWLLPALIPTIPTTPGGSPGSGAPNQGGEGFSETNPNIPAMAPYVYT
jgi:hypothetical protein